MKNFDIIIVGGGASGIMAAITAAQNKKKVALIEASSFIGKKILATGNGRCNLTNLNMKSDFFNQNIDSFLNRFNQTHALNFFEKLGLVTKADESGRVYPFSMEAKSVLSVLSSKLNELNVSLFTNHLVISIQKEKNTFFLTATVTHQPALISKKNNLKNKKTTKQSVLANSFCQHFSCSKLVFASGGRSSFPFETNFPVEFFPASPSLVSLKTLEDTCHLSGIRLSDVGLKAFVFHDKKEFHLNEKLNSQILNFNELSSLPADKITLKIIKEDFGEVLFKDHGLSGIATLNLSTIFARNHNFNGKIIIDMAPKMTEIDLKTLLNSRRELKRNLLSGFLNDSIAKEIFNRLNLSFHFPNSQLTENNISKIIHTIKNFTFTVCGNYENNQVFSGGVPLSALNEKLESKTIKNLYFCGEIIDVDGETGGYNLQWAWTSGYIVGNSL